MPNVFRVSLNSVSTTTSWTRPQETSTIPDTLLSAKDSVATKKAILVRHWIGRGLVGTAWSEKLEAN